jgi:hypothetical protein
MSWTFLLGRYAAAAGFTLVAGAAMAAEFGSFSHPPHAVFPMTGATVDVAIKLPAASQPIGPAFMMTFVLPLDYSTNGKVRVALYLTTSATTPCNMVFVPQQLVRWRPGLAYLSGLTGIAPADGGNLVTFSESNAVVQKVFAITRNPAFPGGQRPGDALSVNLQREPDHPSDTCNGPIYVQAINIRYPRAP